MDHGPSSGKQSEDATESGGIPEEPVAPFAGLVSTEGRPARNIVDERNAEPRRQDGTTGHGSPEEPPQAPDVDPGVDPGTPADHTGPAGDTGAGDATERLEDTDQLDGTRRQIAGMAEGTGIPPRDLSGYSDSVAGFGEDPAAGRAEKHGRGRGAEDRS